MSQSASHLFGSDLAIDSNGRLVLASGADYTRQKVIRRLLSNPLSYLWQSTYGGGLPAQIGGTVRADQMQGIVADQMALEPGVDQTQPITVDVISDQFGTDVISITYVDAQDGTLQTALIPTS